MTQITIPDFCMVLLVGASGSGKTTFARRHFKPTEIVSLDACRGLVDDDENNLDATADASHLVHTIVETRLKRRKLVVVDAANVRKEDRARLVAIAKSYHASPIAMVIDPGEETCLARNEPREDRPFTPDVVRKQIASLHRDIGHLAKEGIRYAHEFRSVEEIDAVEIERIPLAMDQRSTRGPFDIIGDVHGCADELQALLSRLGYRLEWSDDGRTVEVAPPPGRRAIFVGDFVDRGPASPGVLRIVMSMVRSGAAFAVPGNHDVKFVRWLQGRNVKPTHGLNTTIEQMSNEPAEFHAEVRDFLDGLVSHLWLDGGRLVVCHGGIKSSMIGRSSGAVRKFCLYGDTTGETDEFGLPVRRNWAAHYEGDTTIVYGHTPMLEAEWQNNTICLDTGCVYGGRLTALRWPERELISAPAARAYAKPARPLGAIVAPPGLSMETGRRIIKTAPGHSIAIDERQAAAALEVMSRNPIDPKWLIYLPPTMSPPAAATRGGLLEHPDEAFGYYRSEGVAEVVAEEKHTGSRALIAVCRDAGAARRRFGVATGETGAIYTRTGHAFFPNATSTEALLARVRAALDDSGFWQRFDTDWALLDTQVMPPSGKGQAHFREQYAATWTVANAELNDSGRPRAQDAERDGSLSAPQGQNAARLVRATPHGEAHPRYCCPLGSIDDYRIAPFHLLATEGAAHMDKDHVWHMAELHRLADASATAALENADNHTTAPNAEATCPASIVPTAYRIVNLADPESVASATVWWSDLTASGGEGIVVKPRQFVATGANGLIQPAIKCRGREHQRGIHGHEHETPGRQCRHRSRDLGRKRGLALREFMLGQEALHRFVTRQPLSRVHEAVLGVLALESAPVDPRL